MTGSRRPAVAYGSTGQAVARNVKRLREQRGMSIYSLSEALDRAGRPIMPSAIAKLEKQQRQVAVDDLVALAAALNVTPLQLLDPPTGCGICRGTPPPGFTCTECGTTTPKEPT